MIVCVFNYLRCQVAIGEGPKTCARSVDETHTRFINETSARNQARDQALIPCFFISRHIVVRLTCSSLAAAVISPP